tara:strand:+ start:7215 stop:15041 length:7827 start_codon:yes stop_codon:yes gene_type:complete
MKKFLLHLLTIGVICAQAPFAPGTKYPTDIDYLSVVFGGGESTLQNSAGTIFGSVIFGQPLVSQELEGETFNASLGFYSYLLNVPDAPLVTAGDAESGGGITVFWEMDINSPVADASAQFTLAEENTNTGAIAVDKWLLTRKSLSNSSSAPTYFPPQNFGSFSISDNDPAPNIGDFYEYGVTTSNQFGHSKEGTDVGFRTPNGYYQGHVYVISATLSYPHDTQNPGPPVPNVEVTLTPISGEAEGTALVLDGSGDRATVNTNYSSFYDGENDPMTFEVWFNVHASNSTTKYLLDMGSNGMKVYFTDTHLVTSYRGGTTNHTKPASANDDGSTGWYHLAVSYNGSTLESSLYKKLDGTLDEQSASATASTAFSEGQIVFGEQANTLTDGDDLDGILDEIRFWTVAKDSFQIARNRNRSLQKSDTGGERVDDLLAYWKMDEGLGTSAYDMADIDEGEADGKEVLRFDGDATWSTTHSEVKLSAYTDGTGEFKIDDIPYEPGATTNYIPSVALINHDEFQHQENGTNPGPAVGFSETSPRVVNQYFWDHSLFEVSGNIKYANTLYNLDSVEIMIQYGHMADNNGDGVNEWIAGDPNWADQASDRYSGTLTKFAPRTYTDEEGNYAVNLEPGLSARLYAYHGGRWEQTESFTEIVEPFDGNYNDGDEFEDIDGDGVRDACLDDSGGEMAAGTECYVGGDVIENTDTQSTLPYWEFREIAAPVAEKNFLNTHLDTVSLFIGGGECGFSIGDFTVKVNTLSTFPSTSDYGTQINYEDNDSTYAASYDILVPPVPLYFSPVHGLQYVNESLTKEPTGSKIQYLDLSDGPNGEYETDYELKWIYKKTTLNIDRGDFYTVTGTQLAQWESQSGADGEAGTEDDVALPAAWGLSTLVDDNDDVSLYEQPYASESTMNVKQGDYDPDDENEDIQFNRDQMTIFQQGDEVFTEYYVYADYTGITDPSDQNPEARKCGCDDMTFTVADNITGSSLANTGSFDRDGDYTVGKVFYKLVAANVNTGTDHLRNLNVAAQDEYGREGSDEMDAYVLGINEPSAVGGFLSVDSETNPIPFFILRDPPGDQSFAYIEQGESFCQEYSFSQSSSFKSDEKVTVSLGPDIEFEIGFSFGSHFANNTKLDFTNDIATQWTTTNYEKTTEKNVMCMTANETFSTSDIESHSPLLSDLYIGSAMVINSGLGSLLYVEETLDGSGCDDVPCMKIKQRMIAGPEGFPSKFVYSEWFIVNSLLPEIYYNIRYYNTGGDHDPLDGVLWWQEDRRDEIWFLYGTDDGYDQNGYVIPPQSIPALPGSAPNADSLQIMVDLYNHWVSYVQRNQTLKAEATDITNEVYVYPESAADALAGSYGSSSQSDESDTDDPVDGFAEGAMPADWTGDFGLPTINLENISISGGNSYLYEFENTSSATNSIDFVHSQDDVLTGAQGLTVTGVGAVYTQMYTTNEEYTNSGSVVQSQNRKVGIFFQDDDLNDNFNVLIKMDETCMPVYEVTSGRSSNPWEATTSTLKVDQAEVNMVSGTGVVGSAANGGPGADSTVVFNIELLNTSEAEYDRYYKLYLDNSTNSGGAVISGAAEIQGNGYQVYLTYNEPFELDLGVSRGNTDYFYEDLKFYLASPYEDDVAASWNQYHYPSGNVIIPDPQNSDTQLLSVYYNPPCQDLGLVVNPLVEAPAHGNEDVDFVVNKAVTDSFPDGLPMIINGYDLTDDNLVSLELQWISIGGLDDDNDQLWQQSPGSAFVRKGDWIGSTAYEQYDVVYYAAHDKYYRCLATHTSNADFGVDLADEKWEWVNLADIQYAAMWYFPVDGDGEYFVRAKSVCDIADQVSYSQELRILVDTKGPQVFTNTPMDGVLGPDDVISFAFDEFIECSNVDEWSRLVDLSNDESIIPSTATCFENEVIVNINTSVNNALIENHALEARLGGDGLLPVTDLYGNVQEDPSGEILETVSFGFVVDRNPIHWSSTTITEQIFNEVENVFTMELTNNGVEVMTFAFGEDWEIPWWITPSPEFGTINPGGAMEIELSVDPNLPVGVEAGVLYAETQEGDEPLIVTVQVLCPPPLNWEVNPYNYAYSMTLVTNVRFMDNSVTDTYDKLVAIIDGEVRGVQNIGNMFTSSFGNRTSITVYANENPPGVAEQQVSFRLWDSNECSERWDGSIVSGGEELSSIAFEPDGLQGSFLNPVSVNFTNAIARNIDVSEGYTQISFNLQHGSDMSLNSFLQYLNKTTNDRIIGSSGFATWQGDVAGWVSSDLTEINPLETYILYTQQEDQEMYFVGNYIDPETPVSLDQNWTWFSYLPNDPRPVNTSVLHLDPEPSTGDVVKSQFSFRQYVEFDDLPEELQDDDSLGLWLGSLDFFNPGHGYKIYLTAENTTLAFGEQGNLARQRSAPSHLTDIMQLYDDLEFNPHLYQHSMNIISVVESDTFGLNDPEDKVVTYDVEGNIRGVSQPIYIPAIGQYRMFMTLYSNEPYGEQLSMRFHDTSENIWYDCQHSTIFTANEIQGSVLSPIEISLTALSIGDEGYVPEEFILSQNFPNPFNPVTSIGFGVPNGSEVTVTIYNLLGQEVRKLYSGYMEPGYKFVQWDGKDSFGSPGPSGMYIVLMQAQDFIDTKKIILMK